MLLSRIVKLMGTRFNKEIEETLERERSNGTDGVIIEASVCLYDHFIFFLFFFFPNFPQITKRNEERENDIEIFFFIFISSLNLMSNKFII